MRTVQIGLLFAISGAFCFGQLAIPSFQPDRVLAALSNRPVPLAPGLLISIYGEHLGPATGCQPQPGAEAYPKELCETHVLVGGIPAGLLWVQDKQINFQVPPETPGEGTADVQVLYRGRSSQPVRLPAGPEPTTVSLETPARVGMPVWLKVSGPGGDQALQYPLDIHPAGFKCDEVEVRRNGMLLPRIASETSQAFEGTIIGIGSRCGSLGLPAESHHTGRIPLHLQYRFDRPGTYEVRYTAQQYFGHTVRSSWTTIEILPGTQTERTQWLQEFSGHASDDTVDLLTDFLPSLLGIPDQESLELLCKYLYHPDRIVREYAMYGLTYWQILEAEGAVRQTLTTQGPSDVAVKFLTRRPELLARNADVVIESAISYLHSDSPVVLRGAVTALYRADRPLRARAESALIEAADHVRELSDPQTISDYAAALGLVRDARASSILWDFINRNAAAEQAAIALTWRHSLADLPKLAQLALSGNQWISLPYAVRRGYGDAAIPYLEMILEQAESEPARAGSARELVLAGRPSGFAFMMDAIASNRPSAREMLEFLRGQFPELRQADDAAVLAFLKVRLLDGDRHGRADVLPSQR